MNILNILNEIVFKKIKEWTEILMMDFISLKRFFFFPKQFIILFSLKLRLWITYEFF